MAGSPHSTCAPVYSDDQLQRYFSRIEFEKPRPSREETRTQAGLAYLTSLQKHQLSHVPFEDLYLHYTTHPHISLDPDHLYEKIVGRRRGGYCMENNGFFNTVLRSLGYDVYSAGARINNNMNSGREVEYGGWYDICSNEYEGLTAAERNRGHMINLVNLDGQAYMVDVGFGADGPLQPMPLKDGHVQSGLEPHSMRLRLENIAQNTCSSQRLWVYQHRRDDQSPWEPLHCFSELEFIPQDYEVMNYATSTLRTSLFTYQVVCTQISLEGEAVVGVDILVGNQVKRRLKGGRVEHLATCETEKQRVDALRKYFNICLTGKEQQGILSTVAALSSS